jgi:hypothetical protein
MDRPLNVHRGQLRVSGGYRLGLHTLRFNADGQRVDLTDGGLAYVSNTLAAEVKYGILEYLQVALGASYLDQSISAPTNYLVGSSFTEVNSMEVYNGLLDLSLGLDFRAPIRNRKLDLMLSAAATIPTADHNPAPPNHTYGVNTVGTSTATSVNYQYNMALGNGVPLWLAGLNFKYRFENWAFTVSGSYLKPTGEVVTSYWQSQYLASSFENRQVSYNYLLPDELRLFGELEYQLYPWFDLIGEVNYLSTSGGFTEESGTRTVPEETMVLMAGPGFEIIITHRVWFRQRVMIPVSGTSATGPTYYSATVSYNVFLNKK